MKKILFVTTRNVLNTCGELRLINNRAEVLAKEWGVKTNFIVMCGKKKVKNSNEKIKNSMAIYSMDTRNPLSIYSCFMRSKKYILELVKRDEYSAVVLSGVGTLVFLEEIRKANPNINIISDIHGANEDMIQFSGGKRLSKKIYQRLIYWFEERSQHKHLRKVDGIFVVSHALAEYLYKNYNLKKDQKQYVVPCSINTDKINIAEINTNRDIYRNKYGIKENEILFIYSGGVSPWQCIDKSLDIYRRIKSIGKVECRMLVLSHHIEHIAPMITEEDDIIMDSLSPDEVIKALCAGDYAFLLRENIVTNNVAYPNKFLEYVQSGMQIIATPYVYDVANQIHEFGLGQTIELEDKYEEVLKLVFDKKEIDIIQRNELLYKTSFKATLKTFIEEFESTKTR